MVESLEDMYVSFAPAEKGQRHITTTVPRKGALNLHKLHPQRKRKILKDISHVLSLYLDLSLLLIGLPWWLRG